MRVLALSTTDWRGGAARVAHYLTQGLRDRGIHADLLVATKTSDADFVQTIDAPPAPRRGLKRRVVQRLGYGALNLLSPNGPVAFDPARLADYDVVHLHDVPPVSLLDLVRRLDKPIVWTVHSMAPLTGNCVYPYGCDRWMRRCGSCPQFGQWPLIYQARDASAEILTARRLAYGRMRFQAVGVSQWITDRIAESVMGGQPRHTVQNPSWRPDYYPTDRAAARAALGIPDDAFAVMVSVSGNALDLRKGLDITAAATREIRATWPDADRLFLLPTGIVPPDGDMAALLRDIPGLPPRMIEDTATLRRYYTAADVVWHPSRADTSSMVSLEAFGCGTPVIAAAVGGVPEIVRDGVSGLLIPPDDPAALVTATRRLIRDPALMDRLRAGALATARDHNPDRFIDAYLAIYQKAGAFPSPSKDIP
ncbi:Glycosyltransferase involved in cell wall bisynthesis [Loktanella sp. DSM 29012]|nr:Glycosyltransferase involved in cell wall bisynthesis [Loktanella sp. DSM 29012]